MYFGKLQKPQIPISTASQQLGNNEVKVTGFVDQITKKEPPKETQNLQTGKPQTESQKPISKNPEVSKYLYKINDSRTLIKAGELTKYGGIGEETKKRTLLAGKIKQVREEIRKRKSAEQENLQTDREYLQEEKSAELHNLKKISSQIWTLQTRINELSENKLFRLLYTARITKLEERKRFLFEKYGSWEEIGQKIIELNTAKHEKQFKYSQNLAILEKPSPRNPKEMLDEYYEQKLVEFQEKQKLELINSQPVPLIEVVKEYNIFLMHGINDLVENTTTDLYK